MPRYIIKLGGKYFEWSTIVDAPVTNGMTLDEFTEYYKTAYPLCGHGLDKRMARVEKKGTSSHMHDSLSDLIKGNRAGKHESELTGLGILAKYKKMDEKSRPETSRT